MKASTKVGLASFVVTLVLSTLLLASAALSAILPDNFYGTLTVNGIPAPVGTELRGMIGGTDHTVNSPYYTKTLGEYGSPTILADKFQVQGDDPPGAGQTIIFEIKTPSMGTYVQAEQTGTTSGGGNINLNINDWCETYTTKGTCEANDCKWCDECGGDEGKKVNQWHEGKCVVPCTDCGYHCEEGFCDALCDANEDCACPADGCVGPDYYDYPDYGECLNCPGECECDTRTGQGYPCEPTVTLDDLRCIETHAECNYNTRECEPVAGPGVDQCTVFDDCIHTECSGLSCIEIDQPGADQCSVDEDCYHMECDYQYQDCVPVAQWPDVADECAVFDPDCIIPTHTECIDGGCVVVQGEGVDQCVVDEECYHMECDYYLEDCVQVNEWPDVADECTTWEDCDQCVPDIYVEKSADPTVLSICEQTTVTLYVEGVGCPQELHFPIDLMFVLDRSGSMDDDCSCTNVDTCTGCVGTCKICDVKAAAKDFVDLMDPSNDRSGLVSYSSSATLDQGLTYTQINVKNAIDALTAGGTTAIGSGINTANTELINNGRGSAIWVEILLSNGQENQGSNPLDRAQDAADAGIIIFTIGIGSDVNEDTLQDVADITGGTYYFAPSGSDLQAIYEDISEEILNIAGVDVVVTDYIPAHATYVPGSLNSVPADDCSYAAGMITCNLGTMSIGDSFTITFDIEFTQSGILPTNIYPDSVVTFTDYLSDPQSVPFPLTEVEVIPCDDGLYCNGDEYCEAEQCVQGTPPDCSYLDGICQDGVCDEGQDACVPDYYDYSTPCEAEGDYCTIDHCNGEGSCVWLDDVDCSYLDDDYCEGTEIWHDEGLCYPLDGSCYAESTPVQECYYYREYCSDTQVWYEQGYCNPSGPVCDYNTGFVEECYFLNYYCVVDEIYYDEGYCEAGACDFGSYYDDDCDYDGWYDTGATRWVETDQCNEKEQKEQEYQDWYCYENGQVGCDYTVTGTQWVDTGATRYKDDGTPCNDGQYCTMPDTCTQGVCGGPARDCSELDDQCNTGYCNEETDQCEYDPFSTSTPCELDGDLCTIDHCDASEAGPTVPAVCAYLDDVDCSELDNECQVGVCDPYDGYCYPDYSDYPLSTPCNADDDICTLDHCNGEGMCVTYDVIKPVTQITAFDRVCKKADVEANVDACYNVAAAEFFFDECPDETTRGTPMSVLDGYWPDETNEDVYKNNVDLTILLDGRHNIYVRGMDEEGNWGECDAYGFDFDIFPPETLEQYVDPEMACDASTTITGYICDSESGVVYAEYFIKDSPDDFSEPNGDGIPMQPMDGYWGDFCEWVTATVDTSGLSEGTHWIQVHGEDEFCNWGKLILDPVPFVKDSVPPTTEKTVGEPKEECYYYGEEQEAEECWYVTKNTQIELTCEDYDPTDGEYSGAYYVEEIDFYGSVDLNCRYRVKENIEDSWGSWIYPDNCNSFKYPEDSIHELEYWCEDWCENEEEHHYEIDIVDTLPPVIEKSLIGPWYGDCVPQDQSDVCYIDGVTEIYVYVYDSDPHPVNDVVCSWDYEVIGGEKIGQGQSGVTPPFYINFPEESEHVLTITCEDVLGNEVVDVETFYVDKTPPTTTKTYGTPYYTNGISEWITSDTYVTLTVEDSGPHKSGVAVTYWRNLWIPGPEGDIVCGEPGMCYPEFYYQFVNPETPWNVYEDPFQKGEESCHIIEYYSVDNVDKTEEMKWQCVYVDNTPPVIEKEIIGPSEGDCPPIEDDVCYIDGVTEIYVNSYDVGPHPANQVTCDWDYIVVDGVKTGSGQSGITPPFYINFPEESEHVLTITCEDVLGNEVVDVETFYVDKTPPTTTKTYGDPFYTDGVADWITSYTPVTLSVEDSGPHKSGVAATYYIDVYLPDEADWHYCYSDCESFDINSIAPSNPYAPEGWSRYVEPFYKSPESCHVIAYYSVDNVDKVEDIQWQCVFVDDTSPVIDKSITGPWYGDCPPEDEQDTCFIDGVTEIHVDVYDVGPHPVDDLWCYWDYAIDGIWQYNGGNFGDEGTVINFGEDSEHILYVYCEDALGNWVEDHETFIVDKTPPETTKWYEGPQYPVEGYPKWITSDTLVYLEATDSVGPHDSGVAATYWRNTVVDDAYCWDQEYCQEAEGSGSWNLYEGPFHKTETSCHLIEYYSVDNVDKTETVKKQCVFVDNESPVIEKSLTGPWYGDCVPEEQGDICYIDGVTEINVVTYDAEPHPVDEIWCEWAYFVDGYGPYYIDPTGAKLSGVTYFTSPLTINFPEETEHVLYIYCEDALGNWVEDYETFYVDKTPPGIWKTYGSPYFDEYTDYYAEWISVETPVIAGVTDDGAHKSGIKEVMYRYTVVDDEYCMHYDEEDDFECEDAVGENGWTAVDPAYFGEFEFNIDEESCHLIEIKAIDNVDKESVHKQCVFVDDTAPEPLKTVGDPKAMWDGANANFYDIADRCWSEDPEQFMECWYVTTLTPITLDCVDPEPHPVDHEIVCFYVEWDAVDITSEYCEAFDGEIGDDDYCCVSRQYAPLEFYFSEETEHNLKYYCIDTLENVGPIDDEKFKVEGTAFNITLNKKWNLISVPFVMLDDSIEEVFKGVEDKIKYVWTYDAATGLWHKYTPDGIENDDLTTMVPGWGYWVKALEPTTLLIGGSLFSPAKTPPSKELVHGWNLIGYYGLDGAPLGPDGMTQGYYGPDGNGDASYCALYSLIDTTIGNPRWSSLVTYWEPYNPHQWIYLDLTSNMDPGAGYWIEMDVADTYAYSTICGMGDFI